MELTKGGHHDSEMSARKCSSGTWRTSTDCKDWGLFDCFSETTGTIKGSEQDLVNPWVTLETGCSWRPLWYLWQKFASVLTFNNHTESIHGPKLRPYENRLRIWERFRKSFRRENTCYCWHCFWNTSVWPDRIALIHTYMLKKETCRLIGSVEKCGIGMNLMISAT